MHMQIHIYICIYRSPYPIFHILREEEVTATKKKLNGDSSKVFQRNIDLLTQMEEELGRENTVKIMKGDGDQVEGFDCKEFFKK